MKRLFLVLMCFMSITVFGADSEVQDLTDIDTPIVSDDMYIVDDPDVTPASKKINIGNLLGVANDLDTSGDLVEGCVGDTELASTAVTPGDYTATNLTVNADGRITAAANGTGGGGAEWRFVNLPAGSWDYPDTNIAPLDTDTGTNGSIKRQLFDDTTEEFVIAVVQMPSDLDIADTVFFEAYGYAETAVADSYIELTVYHSAKTDGESWDAAYSSKISGDLTTDGSQDFLDYFSWSETVSTLGWAVDDQVRIKLSRSAPTANNLSGDWDLTHFRIKLPRE